MNFNPEVSIVIVAYNRATMLKELLEQLRYQTYTEFEAIICDDCSTDNTNEIVNEYIQDDHRFKYIRNKKNLKMPENLNNGIRHSKGKYIAILHDDDIIKNDTIGKWYSAITHKSKPAFVFNEYVDLDEKLNPIRKYSEDLPYISSGEYILKKIFYNRKTFGSPVWGSVMVRKDVLLEEGLFNSKYGFYSDVDMWLRLCEKSYIAYINEPLIYIRDKKVAPHLFDDNIKTVHQIVQSIFLASRIRYLRKSKIKGSYEVLKHFCFNIYTNMYIFAIRLKSLIKQYQNES